jgi:glucose-1-phosphate cytidylyltransferase
LHFFTNFDYEQQRNCKLKVVILCGGKGTRLREETEYRPKPMVPIGERPILWHIMSTYAHYGHKDFIVCLGYKGEVIKEWFRNLRWMTSNVKISLGSVSTPQFLSEMPEAGWTVTLVNTGEANMTGSRIKQIQSFLGDDEEFLLTYGDGVGTVNIEESIKFHRKHKRILTLTGVRPPGRWGELIIEDGTVSNFFEKPQTSSGLINGGFFVANKKLFNYLDDDPTLVFEQGPLGALSADKQLGCYQHDGFWQPMDTYQEFLLLNRLWREGKAEWKVW